MSKPERYKRHNVFRELNKTLEIEANIFASIYNQMVGLRLNENTIRKVDYLDESLQLNGISKPTLNAMWDTIDSNIHDLSGYLRIKAEEVGKKNISWHELMTSSQEGSLQITFSQASDGKGWVDAEQRKTKSSGGFCAPFTPEGESRISLNYDNSARRLAHELGHAWHFQQILISHECFP